MIGLIAKEGIPFLLVPLLGAIVCSLLGWWILGALLFLFGLLLGFFFRDPNRTIPQQPGLIVSPADGKVIKLVNTIDGTVVSIFLSIFNVHVNRAPIRGIVSSQKYRPGKFRFAFDDRASKENECMTWIIKGRESVKFSLVAGWVARRIVAWKQPGDQVEQGDRIALIRFGSRVDMTVPPGFVVTVETGNQVRGGSSIIAIRKSKSDRSRN